MIAHTHERRAASKSPLVPPLRRTDGADRPDLSVVVPLYREVENVAPLVAELLRILAEQDLRAEIVLVDDGSDDGTAEACRAEARVRFAQHRRNLGQSAALWTGLERARADWVFTLDGDLQNDPGCLATMLAAVEEGAEAVVGRRAKRQDTFSRRFASRLAYRVRNLVTHDGVTDIGCALRLFPRAEALALPRFDGYHRLLPALLRFRGLSVREVDTVHRPRIHGTSKYGNLRRGLRGLLDLLGLLWMQRRLFRTQLDRDRGAYGGETSPDGELRLPADPRNDHPRSAGAAADSPPAGPRAAGSPARPGSTPDA